MYYISNLGTKGLFDRIWGRILRITKRKISNRILLKKNSARKIKIIETGLNNKLEKGGIKSSIGKNDDFGPTGPKPSSRTRTKNSMIFHKFE